LRGAIAPGDGMQISAELRRMAPADVSLDRLSCRMEDRFLPAFMAAQECRTGQAEALNHLEKMDIDLRIIGLAV